VGRVTVLVDPKLRSSHAAKGPAGGGADLVLPSADEMETAGTSLPISRSEAIPERYSRSNQSPLEYFVRRGEQTYDIVLVPESPAGVTK